MAWQLDEQEAARRQRALLQLQQQEEEETQRLRVGVRQAEGAPGWVDVCTDRSFVERSRRRKAGGALKAQERYLRCDVHCGVSSCTTCRSKRALLPSHVLPRVEGGEYVVPDAFSLMQCLDLMEQEGTTFDQVAPRLWVIESVLQAAMKLGSSGGAARLKRVFRGDGLKGSDNTGQFYVFPDQYHVETFVEASAANKGKKQLAGEDRALLKTVEWFVTKNHLPPGAQVVVMTKDVNATACVQLAALTNVRAINCAGFLEERLVEDSIEMLSLVELSWTTAETLHFEETQRELDENGNRDSSETEYSPHVRPALLDELLARASSRFVAGKLEVSAYNPLEAYVTVDGPHAVEKVFLPGRTAMNRGIHGDRVAVGILPMVHWCAPKSDRFLVHYAQDEKDDEKENKGELESVDFENGWHKSGLIPTGQVVGILSRAPKYHVATIISSTVSAGNDHALAVPMDHRLPKIRVRSQRLDALLDKRLKIVIDSWAADSSHPSGHYVEILGVSGSLQPELSAILIDNEVEEAPFSEAALACLPSGDECPIDIEGDCVAECSTAKRPARCKLLNWKVPDEEVPRRRDLRETHRVFSVDPPGCQDIDDAMSVRRLPNGNVELAVHIADVSYFVEHGSALDFEGRRRGTTVYLVGQRLDMLPSVLSADLCSLHENRDRLAVSVICELDGETYDVVENSAWFGRTVIRSCSSMTYQQAHRLLQGTNADVDDSASAEHVEGVAGGRIPLKLQQQIREDLRIITDIGRRLGRVRGSQGGLDLSKQEEVQFSLDVSELGTKDVELTVKENLEIHGTIAELMIFANSTVARRLVEHFPTHALLRRHSPPSGDRFTQLVQLANARGVVIDATNNFTLQQSLTAAERSDRMDSKAISLLKSLAVRVMTEAEYVSSGAVVAGDTATANGDVTPFAHYGLGLQYYTHFTSPIRRYADVIVHRQLLASIAASNASPSTIFQPSVDKASAPLLLPKSLAPSVLESAEDEDFLDDLISSVDHQLQVKALPSAQACARDNTIMGEGDLFPPKELVPLVHHLNKKNRQAKLAARACDALFLALYFSSHTVKVPAIITAFKENGLIVYVPRYDLRAPVYLRDEWEDVQMNPELLGVRIEDTEPATEAFAGLECIRTIPYAQLRWDSSSEHMSLEVAVGGKGTVFHILDEVEVQVSCDPTASTARVPHLQLLLVGRGSAMNKSHAATSLSELQRVVQTKSSNATARLNSPVKVTMSEPNAGAEQYSGSNLYQLLLNAPDLSHPSVKKLARRKPMPEAEDNKEKKSGIERRGPGRLVFGNFSTSSRRHYQHKLAQYIDERTEAREEELSIQRFATGSSAMTSAQEARRAEREALNRTQKLAAEKRHDRINRRNKAGK
uniref:DIS3-like exonuclease 1 n=1 Tax=Hyaloperonospora arabidopsidis (strain Emoy2) TaxID=559515 RepID=M4BN87_HYAAE